jgi:hypothetical protein
VDRLHLELHHSVDRMRRLAGLSDEELGFRYKPGVPLPQAAADAARDRATREAANREAATPAPRLTRAG